MMFGIVPSLDGCPAIPPVGGALAGPWLSYLFALVFCLALGGGASAVGGGAPAAGGGGQGRGGVVREPVLAGRWYEATPSALDSAVTRYLQGDGRPEVPFPDGSAEARSWAQAGRHPAAIVVPHAGHVYSGACAGLTFSLLRGTPIRRVVLLGPNHRVSLRGAALPAETMFATPLGRIELDREAMETLRKVPAFAVQAAAHASEHSLEIELPFLQKVLPAGFTLVPVLIGRLDRADLESIGAAVSALLQDPGTVLVVSSDFTHYGANFEYQPFRSDVPRRLADLDRGAVQRLLARDLRGFEAYVDSTGATICGAEPIRVLLQALAGRELEGRWIDYYRSGDLMDDFSNTVSYAGVAFFPATGSERTAAGRASDRSERGGAPLETAGRPRLLDEREQAFLLSLARQTVRAAVRGQKLPAADPPEGIPAGGPLQEHRGVFVTLTEAADQQLRGCIGNILGDRPLIAGTIENAVNAALRDPRFLEVTPEEEPLLHIEISVLTPLQSVAGPEAIVAGRDGVVLEKSGRRAVFLPQVAAEQGWDVPTMLRHLSMKAGLDPNAWRSGATFQVFQAQVFEEAP